MMIEELETALAEEAEGKAAAEAALAESETKLKQAVRSLETISSSSSLLLFCRVRCFEGAKYSNLGSEVFFVFQVDMAREKVMALSKENAELRKGKKR